MEKFARALACLNKMAWAFWFFEFCSKDVTIFLFFLKGFVYLDLEYVSFFSLNICYEKLQQIKFLLVQSRCF